MKLERFLLMLVLSLALIFVLGACSDDDDDDAAGPGDATTITLGALLPLTGDLAVDGESVKAGIELALADVDASLEAAGTNVNFELVTLNTETEPSNAAVSFRALELLGARIILGPMSSAELESVKVEADEGDAIVISPSSTVASLAIDDNIFRIVSTDEMQAQALAEAMWADGIRHIVQTFRDDVWGNALAELVADAFEGKGGTVIRQESYFSLRASVYEEVIDSLSRSVKTALETADTSEIALQLSSFGEGVFMMEAAIDDTILSRIHWYGSDGLVRNSYLISDEDIAAFATLVQFSSPVFGFEMTEDAEDISARIETETGAEATVYGLLAYDAAYVAARTLAAEGEDVSLATLKTSLFNAYDEYEGISGSCSLNASGDRVEALYYFWTVAEDGGYPTWLLTRIWDGAVFTAP